MRARTGSSVFSVLSCCDGEAIDWDTLMGRFAGLDEVESVESQIVWCNVDDELLRQDFTRLNSSCSPQFVSAGMSALLAHGSESCHSLQITPSVQGLPRAPPEKDGDMDRRLSSGDTVKNDAATTKCADSSERGARNKTGML